MPTVLYILYYHYCTSITARINPSLSPLHLGAVAGGSNDVKLYGLNGSFHSVLRPDLDADSAGLFDHDSVGGSLLESRRDLVGTERRELESDLELCHTCGPEP